MKMKDAKPALTQAVKTAQRLYLRSRRSAVLITEQHIFGESVFTLAYAEISR